MKHLNILAFLFLTLIIGCSDHSETQKKLDRFYGECDNPARPLSKIEKNICKDRERALIGDPDKEAFSFESLLGNEKNNNSSNVVGMALNRQLWQASLEVVNQYPLTNIDSLGGYIETDWILEPGFADKRCKIKIAVLSSELVSTGVDARIICQNYQENNWINSQPENDSSKKLTLRILELAQSNNL